MKTLFCFLVFWFTGIAVQAENGVENPGKKSESKFLSSISGEWEHILSASELPELEREENAGPSQIETASLRYNFLEDGTFIRTLIVGKNRYEERGRWEVTSDDKILFFYSVGHPSESAEVKYLEPEEMVLELSLHIPGFDINLESRQVFFHKL
jgi:hypothetical protein